MAALMIAATRIPHDKDATPIEASMRIRFDIHSLNILDRKRATVNGDGIRRALPSHIWSLPRQ